MKSAKKSNPKDSRVSVLIFGDVQGKFQILFNTMKKLLAVSGQFEAAYCIGSFFGDENSEWDLVKIGKISPPIPCYVLGPCKPEHEIYYPHIDGMELAHNIIYLGRKGILSTLSGLKVAYFSGIESQKTSKSTFSNEEVKEFKKSLQPPSFKQIDLLLTSQWPKNITKGISSEVNVGSPKNASQLISSVAIAVKPCYHFAGLENIHFHRCPYRYSNSFFNCTHTTKFVGLGKLGSEEITCVHELHHIPQQKVTNDTIKLQKKWELATECPFEVQSTDISVLETQVFSRYALEPTKNNLKERRTSKKDSRIMQNCWFCLRMPTESHLIAIVGEHCYISLAKGWLTKEHLLIIPNSHCNSIVNLKKDVLQEISDFKLRLKAYFHLQNKHVVFYERNFRTPHLQIQVVPIPVCSDLGIENAFMKAAAEAKLELKEIPPYSDVKQIANGNLSYFCVEIHYVNRHIKKFFHDIQNEFPLLFAREVLASRNVLNVPDLIDWKKSGVTHSEEKLVSESFKNCFMTFCQKHNFL